MLLEERKGSLVLDITTVNDNELWWEGLWKVTKAKGPVAEEVRIEENNAYERAVINTEGMNKFYWVRPVQLVDPKFSEIKGKNGF